MRQELLMIGEMPEDLSPKFTCELDGSIATLFTASGFYAGVLAAEDALIEQFADRLDLLDEIRSVFYTSLGEDSNG